MMFLRVRTLSGLLSQDQHARTLVLWQGFIADVPAAPRVGTGHFQNSLLVREAVELDPIDLFLLQGVASGLRTPQELTCFFGLEQDVIESSIGDMLHNEWVTAHPGAGDELTISLQPTGHEVLSKEHAIV